MVWGFLMCYWVGLEVIELKTVPGNFIFFFKLVNILMFVIHFGVYYVRAGITLETFWGEKLPFCALCVVLSLAPCICWPLPWKKCQCFVSCI